MDLGSIFLIVAAALLVGLFIAWPFYQQSNKRSTTDEQLVVAAKLKQEHARSTLLAERDRILNALQELEFDQTLGKIPEEDYPTQRAALMQQGADVLRQLDEMEPETAARSTEERLEAALSERRAARHAEGGDELEARIAARRQVRQEKAAGFCPKCGRPVQKSDAFCPRCGAKI